MTRFSLALGTFALALSAAGLPATGHATDSEPLREGYRADIGINQSGNVITEARADFSIVPLPGGGKLNGTRIDARATITPAGSLQLDRARLQLLNLSHLRGGGFSIDRELGAPFTLDGVGVSVPLRIAGETESQSWIVAHIGADVGYRWLNPKYGGKWQGHGTTVSGQCRMDEQLQLSDRLALRGFQEVTAAALLSKDDQGELGRALVARAGGGVYWDLTPSAPVRLVPRTNPATGERTYRTLTNPGPRARWMVVGAEGAYHVFDTTSVYDKEGIIKTAVNYDF